MNELLHRRSANETLLSGLYYPFSRCINQSSLKQMLLVFDTVHFLDPVDDEAWRANLFEGLENAEDARFHKYRDLYSVLQDLLSQGAVARVDPEDLQELRGDATAASALSDVLDSDWTSLASRPQDFGLPHRNLGPDGGPTWQAFLQKLPMGFVEALADNPELRHHLVRSGGEHYSWTLSYAAGSAAATSLHLAAAEQLDVAPVTDSTLHHELLLRKITRLENKSTGAQPLSAEVIRQLTTTITVALVSDLLSQEGLRRATFDEVLAFRDRSHSLRNQFVRDIGARLAAVKETASPDHLAVTVAQIKNALERELRGYQAEMRSVRDKVWPAFASSVMSTLPSGGVAAVSMSYIGGPGYVVAASIVAASLALLKSGLDLRAERHRVEGSAAPGVAYLSQVAEAFS